MSVRLLLLDRLARGSSYRIAVTDDRHRLRPAPAPDYNTADRIAFAILAASIVGIAALAWPHV